MHPHDDTDYSKPVAYDTNGRPLYAHPPKDDQRRRSEALQYAVHIARAAEPEKPKISEATQRRHEKSVAQYPRLNLTEGEFVVSEIKRHPIGIYAPASVAGLLITMILVGLMNYSLFFPNDQPPFSALLLPAAAAIGLISIGTYIVIQVYLSNRLILTNESAIQEIQHTLFSHHEQTVSLGNIEDVSYTRYGLLQTLLNYGTIRMSTEGEETTYQFQYAANPKAQAALLHNAVEAFKNGRPIVSDED